MKIIDLPSVRNALFELESPSKTVEDGKKSTTAKPISQDMKPFKQLPFLKRTGTTFISVDTLEDLSLLTNLLVNVFCIYNKKATEEGAISFAEQAFELKKALSVLEKTSTENMDKQALKKHQSKVADAKKRLAETVSFANFSESAKQVASTSGAALLDSIVGVDGCQTTLLESLAYAPTVISTHNVKIIDTSYKSQVIAAHNCSGSSFGLSSFDLDNYRQFGVFTKQTFAAVFSFEFIFNGQKTNLLKLLATDKQIVEMLTAKFSKATGSKDAVEKHLAELVEISSKLLNGESHTSAATCTKQLLFPVAGEDYVAMTPVPAFAMLQALRGLERRFFEDEAWTHSHLNSSAIKVGGTNSINAGDYNLDTGGSHPLLLARIPTIKLNKWKSVEDRVSSIIKRNSLFEHPRNLDKSFVDKLEAASAKSHNIKTMNYMRVLLESIVSRVTSTVVFAYRNVESETLSCTELEKEFVHGLSFLPEGLSAPRTRNSVIDDLTEMYSQRLLGEIKSAISVHKGVEDFEFTSSHKPLLYTVSALIKEDLKNA